MAKKVFYDDDARRRLLSGAKLLYDAVKVTMGPKGRNVIVGRDFGTTVTHDGVTVAKSIELPETDDETLGYKAGAELIKEAASRLNDAAGDGTTTVTVLTYNILNEANRLIAAGHNPMDLRKGVESAAADALARLKELREPIENKKGRIAEVATISAGDAEIGKLIAEVVEQVGKDGVVTVQEGQTLELEKEIVEGYTLERGYMSPYFITDPKKMEAIYDNVAVVIVDGKIQNTPSQLLPILEKIKHAGKKELLLICDEIDAEPMQTLILNKLKDLFNTVAVSAPAFGDRQKDLLDDIARLTGATVISDESGHTFAEFDLSMVGAARRVIVARGRTTIIDGSGSKEDVALHAEALRARAGEEKSDFEREYLMKRVAALEGKVAIIKVGGKTDTEIEEKKYRVDDATAATKAALAEGIVAGGGVTLVELARCIEVDPTDKLGPGRQLLKNALVQPFRQLMSNAGVEPGGKLDKVRESGEYGFGFDVNNPDELVSLRTIGVVDPARVTREAIENSVSIAATAMTMGALVVDIPEDLPQPPMGPMGMM